MKASSISAATEPAVPRPPPVRRTDERCFVFERDTFAFANELIWEYRIDPATGSLTTARNDPPPTYAHRCFVLIRSARQFFYHARFDPSQAKKPAPAYRSLIHEVISRTPRRPCPEAERVVIPGYEGLRAFSREQEPLLKATCGGAWQSYFLRSHWRMVFPVTRRHQAQTARQLLTSLETRILPLVHVVRFPQLTINHGLALFGVAVEGDTLTFAAYDPNLPGHATELKYQAGTRTFFFPRNHYWAGGRVDVIEIYRGWFY